MPVALGKVQDRIRKKGKATGAMHAFSRDTRSLRRASGREEKLSRAASAVHKGRKVYLDRVHFFEKNITDTHTPVSAQNILLAVQTYINRHDAEMQELESERRKNRPIPKRLESLRSVKESEVAELETNGFIVPDVTTEENRERIKKWNGEWNALNAVAFVRVKSDGEVLSTPFPPKGAS